MKEMKSSLFAIFVYIKFLNVARADQKRSKKLLKNRSKASLKKKKQESQLKKLPYFGNLINVCYLAITAVFFVCTTNLNTGYSWIFNSMLKDTYSNYDQVSELTTEQKLEAKLGFDAKYLFFLKKNTSPNAVILMPPIDSIKRGKVGRDFSNTSANIGNLSWASYFVYPRKLVYEGESSMYLDSVSHVAIVDKWGYQYSPNIPSSKYQKYSIIKL